MLLCQSSNHVPVLFLDPWNFFSKCSFFNCLLNYVALLSNFPDEKTLKVLKNRWEPQKSALQTPQCKPSCLIWQKWNNTGESGLPLDPGMLQTWLISPLADNYLLMECRSIWRIWPHYFIWESFPCFLKKKKGCKSSRIFRKKKCFQSF